MTMPDEHRPCDDVELDRLRRFKAWAARCKPGQRFTYFTLASPGDQRPHELMHYARKLSDQGHVALFQAREEGKVRYEAHALSVPTCNTLDRIAKLPLAPSTPNYGVPCQSL